MKMEHGASTVVDWSAAAENALRQRDAESGTFGAPSATNIHFPSRSMSKNEYYRLSGFNKRASVLNGHVESVSSVKAWNQGGAESSKTSDVDRYSQSLDALFGVYDDLMRFYCGTRWWRRLKAGTAVKTQQMLETAVEKITGFKDHEKQKNVVIAFGDASIGHVNGCAPVGNKRLREFLKKRACVIETDEFRSSKLCSCCHHEMKGLLLEDGKRSWGIRCCEFNKCMRELFDRDINAAINILFRMIWILRGEEIPRCFQRGVELEEEKNAGQVEVEEDEEIVEAESRTDGILLAHA
jgi:hypothetical protein